MKLVIFVFLSFFLEAVEIKNKLVIDYGNFLEIDQQKELHLALENFYKESNIYISIVTLDKENVYNLNKSLERGIKKIIKKGFKNIIIILRSVENYNFYILGFENNLQIKDITDKITKNIEKNKEYFEEFKNLIKLFEKEKSVLSKYVTKNGFNSYFFKYKYYLLIFLLSILSFIVNIYRKRKKYFERLGIK